MKLLLFLVLLIAACAPTATSEVSQMAFLPAPPSGSTIVRSVGPIFLGEADGNDIGCAFTVHATGYYATDFRGPHDTDPMASSVTFGPHPTLVGARSEIDPFCTDLLDAEGTDGTSAWLVLP